MAAPLSKKQHQKIKVMLYLKKLDTISDKKFHSYWAGNHVDLAVDNKNFMSKVRRYSQFHTSPELKKQAAVYGVPVLEFDGIAEVWVDSLEEWTSIVSDTDFIKNIGADEAHFIKAPIHIMIGTENLVIGDALDVSQGDV